MATQSWTSPSYWDNMDHEANFFMFVFQTKARELTFKNTWDEDNINSSDIKGCLREIINPLWPRQDYWAKPVESYKISSCFAQSWESNPTGVKYCFIKKGLVKTGNALENKINYKYFTSFFFCRQPRVVIAVSYSKRQALSDSRNLKTIPFVSLLWRSFTLFEGQFVTPDLLTLFFWMSVQKALGKIESSKMSSELKSIFQTTFLKLTLFE